MPKHRLSKYQRLNLQAILAFIDARHLEIDQLVSAACNLTGQDREDEEIRKLFFVSGPEDTDEVLEKLDVEVIR